MAQRFWLFARPYLGTYLVGLVFLLLTNALVLTIPWLLRGAVNALEQRAPLSRVAGFALGIAGVALVQALTRTASRLSILGTARRIVFDIRNAFFRQLQRLGASFYDTHRTGDIMSRGVNDIQLIQSFYGPGVLNLLNTTVVYVATLAMLLRIDPRLTLISLMLYPVLLFVVNRLSRRVYARSLAVQEQLAAISNRSQENLGGIQQVKTYAQEDREIDAFRELTDEFRRRNLAMARIRGAMLSVIGIASGTGVLIVLLVGGRHVIEGRIGFGDFVAFQAYLAMLAWPTIAMGWIINVFQRGSGAMRRVDELLSAVPDVPAVEDDDAEAATPAIGGEIVIRDLTFSYSGPDGGDGAPALHGIDLTIPAGSRVALVGQVGSGKSTLVNLLARAYPVPRGAITIGGRDINDIPVAALRRSLGYVPQEAFLFSRSMRDNILFRDPDAGDEAVARALRMSHLVGDIETFPKGLDTVVGERGFTVSGGQRQRATLARALVGDPTIVILDDSLSSVDADTERAILAELHDALAGRTCILISHRISTLSGVDRVIVLDEGRIVEQGTHRELIGRDGVYARLFRRQQLEEQLDAS